jgi:hypothetical protein
VHEIEVYWLPLSEWWTKATPSAGPASSERHLQGVENEGGAHVGGAGCQPTTLRL